MLAVGALFDTIRAAVQEDRHLLACHADERGVSAWQLVAGLAEAELPRERRASRPNPSVVVGQVLPHSVEVEVVWAWLSESRRAKSATVFFRD
jgi:hypothetical protein